MSNLDAFLASIRDPADTTARLVFADWLDDRGDAVEAEMIRVECALASPYQPGTVEQCSDLLHRQRELDATHPDIAARWLGHQGLHLGDVLQRFAGRGPEYSDGLPQAVLVEWCKLTDGVALSSWPTYQLTDGVALSSWPTYQIKRSYHGMPRWEAIQGCKPNMQLFADHISRDHGMNARSMEIARQLVMDGEAIMPSMSTYPRVETASQRGKAIVIRDLKRRVLALFPEVRCCRQHDISLRAMDLPSYGQWRRVVNDKLEEFGFRLDMPMETTVLQPERFVRFQQTLAAPDWIPPEPLALEPTGAELSQLLPWMTGPAIQPTPAGQPSELEEHRADMEASIFRNMLSAAPLTLDIEHVGEDELPWR